MGDSTRRHRVVAEHALIWIGHGKGTAGSAQLVGRGAAFEPFIEYRFATLESVRVQAVRVQMRPCCPIDRVIRTASIESQR